MPSALLPLTQHVHPRWIGSAPTESHACRAHGWGLARGVRTMKSAPVGQRIRFRLRWGRAVPAPAGHCGQQQLVPPKRPPGHGQLVQQAIQVAELVGGAGRHTAATQHLRAKTAGSSHRAQRHGCCIRHRGGWVPGKRAHRLAAVCVGSMWEAGKLASSPHARPHASSCPVLPARPPSGTRCLPPVARPPVRAPRG